MKEITTIPLSALPNGAHFDYVKDILSEAENCPAVAQKALTQLNDFRKATEAEDEVLKVMRASEFTEEIARADNERDALYSGLKTSVNAFMSMPIPDMQEAANPLAKLIREYAINPAAQLNTESGMLTNFIDDLQKKYATQLAKLNLTTVVERLKEANEQVKAYTKDRTHQRRKVNVGATRAARAVTDAAYTMLVKMVNALALVNGEADYAEFIDYVNTQITQYKRDVLKQSATKPETTPGQPDDETPEQPGGDTPEKPEDPTPKPDPDPTPGGGDSGDEFV